MRYISCVCVCAEIVGEFCPRHLVRRTGGCRVDDRFIASVDIKVDDGSKGRVNHCGVPGGARQCGVDGLAIGGGGWG